MSAAPSTDSPQPHAAPPAVSGDLSRSDPAVLTAVLDAVPDAIFWKDRDGRFRGCNQAFARTVGKTSPADIVGRTDSELGLAEEDSANYRADDHAVLTSGQPRLGIVESLPPLNGCPRWGRTDKIPLATRSGEVVGVLGILHDTTAQQAAESARRRSEALLRSALETIEDGLLVVDADGQVSLHNNRFLEIWAIPPALAAGRNDQSLLALAAPQLTDPATFSSGVDAIYRSTEKTHDTLHFRDGRIIERYSTRIDREGANAERMWLFRDVTAQVRTAENLRDREKRLANVFQAAPVSIGVVSDRVIRECNETTCAITGRPREELIGQSTRVLYPSEQEFAAAAVVYQQLQHHPMTSLETRWLRTDGSVRDILLTVAPLDPGNPRQDVTFIGMDITKRKEAEGHARQLVDEQRTILETLSTGIALLRRRKHVWANAAFCALFGYTKDELIGLDSSGMYSDHADYLRVGTEGYPVLATGATYSAEVRLRRRDGTLFWCNLAGRAIAPDNLEAGTIWALTDISARKLAEEALRQSELFLSRSQAVGRIGSYILDLTGAQCWRCTPIIDEIFGLPPDFVKIGQNWLTLVVERQAVEAHFENDVIRDHRPFDMEYRIRRPVDGQIRWIYGRGELDFAPDGAPLHLIGTVQDITTRHEAEEALRASESRFRALAENSLVGLLVTQGPAVRYCNPRLAGMLGYDSPADLIGSDPAAAVSPEYRDEIKRRLAAVEQGEAVPPRPGIPLLRRDGSRIWVQTGPVTSTWDGRPSVQTFVIDITEQKRALDSLRLSEERLRLATERTGLLILDYDLASDHIHWLGTPESVIGYTLTQINQWGGGWWTRQIHPDDLPEAQHSWRQSLSTGHPTQRLYRFRHADGRWVHLMANSAVIAGEDGRPSRMFSAVSDVSAQQHAAEAIRRLNTELEQRVRERTAELDHRIAEQQQLMADLRTSEADLASTAARLREANGNLLAANDELESFSYSVSHDLRAPLRNIAGFIELLRRRAAGQLDKEADRYFSIVGSEAVRMGALIDDLLTFSRIGRAELHLAPVELATLVAEVQAEFQSDLAGRQIDWHIEPMPTVLGDRTLLRQVVANLLANAIKFTRLRSPAVIEVGVASAAPGTELVTFFVRDNGAGFDPKYAAKLFGVFQRLHNIRDYEGTGIGLANVKRIVNRHGGHVWAEGAVDHGATFFFSLKPAAS